MTPPASPAGVYKIDVEAGSGYVGSAGEPGQVTLSIPYSTRGGHVKVFNTGVANASWTAPDADINLGAAPCRFSKTNTTSVYEVTFTNLADLGQQADPKLANGISCSGIEVGEGATLRFKNSANLTISHDLHNMGTIEVMETAAESNDLTIACASFISESDSKIILVGDEGMPGGNLSITAYNTYSEYSLEYAGIIVNKGTIDTSGGTGNNGNAGQAGAVVLSSKNNLFNYGAINSVGGTATTASTSGGNNGGNVTLSTEYGNLYNAGPITTSGGPFKGGNGGDVLFNIIHQGNLRNTHTIMTTGGTAVDSTGSLPSGTAGNISFNVAMGSIINLGDLIADGGEETGKIGNATGGNGGKIAFTIEGSTSGDSAISSGDLVVSGNISAKGGAGPIGGKGGSVSATLSVNAGSYETSSQEIIFYGYTEINANGGAGFPSGGIGGAISFSNGDSGDYDAFASGGVVNYANISAKGGSGNNAGGNGGIGGSFLEKASDYRGYYAFDSQRVFNFGTINVSGGDGAGVGTNGGSGGIVAFDGYGGATNNGNIIANGGTSLGTTTVVYAGVVAIRSDMGIAKNTAIVSCNGGDVSAEDATGGGGGIIELIGALASNTGTFTSNGGNATATGATGGWGGDGGVIQINSNMSFTTDKGINTVTGGASSVSAKNGANGKVLIDGTWLRYATDRQIIEDVLVDSEDD